MNVLDTMESNRRLKPKEVSDLAGVSVKTLQRWDSKGILKARRTATNRRYYYPKDLVSLFKGLEGFGPAKNRHNLTSPDKDHPTFLHLLEQRHSHLGSHATIVLGNRIGDDFEAISEEIAYKEAGGLVEYVFNPENPHLAVLSPNAGPTTNFLRATLFSLFDAANPEDLKIAMMGDESDQWAAEMIEQAGYGLALDKLSSGQQGQILIINHVNKVTRRKNNREIIQKAMLTGAWIIAIDSSWQDKNSKLLLSQFDNRVIYGPLEHVERNTFLTKNTDGKLIMGSMESDEFVGQISDSTSPYSSPLEHGIIPRIGDDLTQYLMSKLTKQS